MSNPAIDSVTFPGTVSSWYWSSSPYSGYADYAWYVGFYDGGVDGSYRSNSYYVRLVR